MREGGIRDIDELIDFTLAYCGVLLNWFQLLMNYWLKSNVILKNIRINNIKSPKMLTLRFFFPSRMPLYGPLCMDNSLISCLCYFIYLYRTVVKRSDSLLLFIYSPTRRRDNYKAQASIYFDDFVFRILLVQNVINLENIGQKTLEKSEGAAKSGQYRSMSHIGLKS